MVRPTGVLVATDREIGTGQGMFAPVVGTGPGGAACDTAGDQCWTKYQFTFDTTRPAFTGEQLTFQVQLLGARSWAFGFEGEHASKIAIDPAPLPDTGLEFGASRLPGGRLVHGGGRDGCGRWLLRLPRSGRGPDRSRRPPDDPEGRGVGRRSVVRRAPRSGARQGS